MPLILPAEPVEVHASWKSQMVATSPWEMPLQFVSNDREAILVAHWPCGHDIFWHVRGPTFCPVDYAIGDAWVLLFGQ